MKLPAVAWVAIFVPVAIGYGLILGVQAWRANTFDRTIATVVSVRTEEWETTTGTGRRLAKGEPRYVTMAELAFNRIDAQGRSVGCRHEFMIGTPEDGFVPGDKVEIIPATGSCQRAEIVGRLPAQP